MFLVRTVSADGLWLAQPQVGDWVEFETKNDLSGPTARDSVVRRLWLAKCGGSEIRKDVNCQWIEVKESRLDQDVENSSWNRFLIPEVHLKLRNATAFDVVEHWKRQGRGTVMKHDGPVSEDRFRMFFPGLLKSKEVKVRKQVHYADGSLTCERRIEQEIVTGDGTKEVRIRYTLWPRDKVPFGVAATVIEVKHFRNGEHLYTWHREFTLGNFGTNASSEFKE